MHLIIVIVLILFFLVGCTPKRNTHNIEAADINAKLGMVYLSHGKLELARSKLLNAFKQNPNSYEVNKALSCYFRDTGNNALAKKYYLQAIKYNKQDSFEQKLES